MNCLICRGKTEFFLNNFYRCRDCGFIRRESPLVLVEEFSGPLKADNDRAYEAVFRKGLKELKIKLPDRGKLLDIGCSGGFFPELALSDGWDVEGVELSLPCADSCRNKGIKVYQKPLEELFLPDSSYEAVTMFSTLSQTADFRKTAAEAFRILKPGGVILLREYNALFQFSVSRFSGFFSIFGAHPVVFHNWNFTEKSLHMFLTELGFTEIETKNSPPSKGAPYSSAGIFGKAIISMLKNIYFKFSKTAEFLSGGQFLISSSIMVKARKRK